MLNYEITSIVGKHKNRKRVGRGRASGNGKTAGRGHNGDGSRAGAVKFSLSEGGQMPLFRRLPKRGFNNANFEKRFEIVNISQLDMFDDGSTVGAKELTKAGLIVNLGSRIKILGDGELTKKLDISAHKFSKSAEQKIVASGGKVNVI